MRQMGVGPWAEVSGRTSHRAVLRKARMIAFVTFAIFGTACGHSIKHDDAVQRIASSLVNEGNGDLVHVRYFSDIHSEKLRQVLVYRELPMQDGLCMISGASVTLDKDGRRMGDRAFKFTSFSVTGTSKSCSAVDFDRYGSKDDDVSQKELFEALRPLESCLMGDVKECEGLGVSSLSSTQIQIFEALVRGFDKSNFYHAFRFREQLILQYAIPGDFCNYVDVYFSEKKGSTRITNIFCGK